VFFLTGAIYSGAADREEAGSLILVPQIGHAKGVIGAVFSPDGKKIATSSHDGSIKLWDARSGRLLWTFAEEGRNFNCAAFSPDGSRIALGMENGMLRIFDAHSGDILKSWGAHEGAIISLAFSPDSSRLLSGSKDRTASLWDAVSGASLFTVRDHGDWVTGVAFAPDGKAFVTGSPDRSLRLRDAATGNLLRVFSGSSSGLLSVVFSVDGKNIVSSGNENAVKTWEIQTGRLVRTFPGPPGGLVFSPDGQSALTLAADDTIRLWDLISGEMIRSFSGNAHGVSSASLSPDGWSLVTGSGDDAARLWDIETGQLLHTFSGNVRHISKASLSPDHARILTGFRDGEVKIWDLRTGALVRTYQGHTREISCAVFSKDGHLALTGGRDSVAHLWNVETGATLRVFPSPGWVESAAFSPDGREVLIASQNLQLWDISSGKLIRTLNAGSVQRIAFSPDGENVFVRLQDGSSRQINLRTGDQTESERMPDEAGSPVRMGVVIGPDMSLRFQTSESRSVAVMLPAENGSLVYTPEGYFDYTSPEIKNRITFRRGGSLEAFDFDSVYDRFYRPGLLGMALAGRIQSPSESIDELNRTSPAPEVTISIGTRSESDETAEITIRGCDRGGGVEELRIYQNDALVNLQRARTIQTLQRNDCVVRTYRLELAAGRNNFRGTARSRKLLEGTSAQAAVLFHPAAVEKPDRHVVLVAINNYRYENLRLRYAVPDAESLRGELQKRSGDFRQTIVHSVYDDRATKQGISAVFRETATTSHPDDLVIIYLSGHGYAMDGTYYFIPADSSANSEDQIKLDALTQSELIDWISAIPARKKLIILDTCESGGDWAVSFRSLDEQRAMGRLARAAGIWVIAASQDRERALETSLTGHGLLATALLEVIEKEVRLSAGQMTLYVENRVPELARELSMEQRPYTQHRGQDFPLW